MSLENKYLLICDSQSLNDCTFTNAQDLTSFSQALNTEVITVADFWQMITMVAVTWAIAHLIRQALNLVQWRR